ncbi:hypothetical protein GCM10027299_28270 [Larkinella ripae]
MTVSLRVIALSASVKQLLLHAGQNRAIFELIEQSVYARLSLFYPYCPAMGRSVFPDRIETLRGG